MDNMSIHSLFVIELKMTLVNIIAISVKKSGTQKYWFYYCEDCSYVAHPNCIIGKYPNYKFGGACTFDCHSHPLTFIEETKICPQCNKCNGSCEELIYQCAQCNFYIHKDCL